MVARFGDVCYWIGLIPAICFWGALIFRSWKPEFVEFWGAFLIFGGIPFAIGWFIRYIATGRTDISPAPTPTD